MPLGRIAHPSRKPSGQLPASVSSHRSLRARWWSLLFHVFDTTRSTVSNIYRSSGSAVYGTPNPLERSIRDIHAIATTFEQPSAQAFRADAGRVLAGKDPILPFF